MNVFIEKNGTFAVVHKTAVIAVDDFLALQSHPSLTNQEKDLVERAFNIFNVLPVKEFFVKKPGAFSFKHEKSYTLLAISSWLKTFPEILRLDQTTFDNQLKAAKELNEFWKEFCRICARYSIPIEKKSVPKVVSIAQSLENKEFNYKTLDELNNFGSGYGYAVFYKNGYLDFQKRNVALVGARIFASEELARNFYPQGTIVKIELSLNQIVSDNNNQKLEDALSAQQKKRLEQEMEHLEMEQLRERLAELEGKYSEISVTKTQPKRKM